MNIISQFADQTVVQDILSGSPEMERFAFEFCKEFKCVVEQPIYRMRTRLRPTLHLLTPEGLPVGSLSVDPRGDRDKDGKHVPVYFYDSPAVQKSKGSARASRSCRDSTNIKAIITAVKKNKEAPSIDTLIKAYGGGISYAFGSIHRGIRSPRLDLNGDEGLALVLSYLELDKNSVKFYDDSIKQKYTQLLDSKATQMDSQITLKRFAKGSYLIGWMKREHDESPYYVVADVSADDHDKFTFHTPLKRYKTLMDCPEIAHHVPIIAAWASGVAGAFALVGALASTAPVKAREGALKSRRRMSARSTTTANTP